MKTILKYFKPYTFRIILQLIIKFLGTIVDLLIPWILSYILDKVIPLNSKKTIYIWGGGMILCAIVALISNIIANRMASKTSSDATEHIRHDLFSKISYLSAKQVDNFTIPSLISRLSSDSYNVHQMTTMMQRLGVRAPILLIGGICITMTLEPVLTVIMILTLPLLGFLIYKISKNGIPLYTEVQKAVDIMVRKVQENMTGIRIIKALSKSDYEKEHFDQISKDVVKKDRKASLIMALTNPTMNLLLNLGLCAVIIVGAYRVNSGFTGTGTIIAFLNYFTMILNAMMMVTRMFIMYSKGTASAKRIEEVLLNPNELLKIKSERSHTNKTVAFKNVSFSYNEVQNNLENIDFELSKGESLGIFGATGSGKSTIINLLLRFYDPQSGEILIDGKDIRNFDPQELRSKFGVVFQNDFIFADTIRENINFGRNLTDKQIENAVNLACAEFVYEKEDKLMHELTIKGANLSGGQKQRLLISRALAHSPEILIFDDSSSALDYKTDARLRKNIAESLKTSTTIIVASRISSIMHCNQIIVLDNGKIIGKGTHNDLYLTLPDYREISDIQLGGTRI